MTCNSEILQAAFDGELDPGARLAVEDHIRECAGCRGELERLRDLRNAIRLRAPRYSVPEGFENQVRTALRDSTTVKMPAKTNYRRLLAAAAILLFMIGIVAQWLVIQGRQEEKRLLARAIVTSHVRSLMPGHLIDVPSSDQHTVKPWFAGKLDFSPEVKDLKDKGFELVGGRLEYLEGHTVAAIVYKRRQHLINVLVWPEQGKGQMEPRVVGSESGYNSVQWRRNEITYWAVSDLNAQELLGFGSFYWR